MNTTNTTQKELMDRVDEIAAECGISVSTYPGPRDRCTISTYDDSELPAEFVAALSDAGIEGQSGFGCWPTLWGFAGRG